MNRRPIRNPRQRSWLAFTLSAATLVVVAFASVAALTRDAADAQAQATPPQNTSLPTISGTAALGETLSASSGSWSGDTPMTFAYQWRRCDSNGASCLDIPGATGATRVVDSDDVGVRLRVRVTATNTAGQASAESDATAVVTTARAPVAIGEPAISGSPVQGQTLSASNGSWSGTQPIAYAYQWVRCGTDGGAPDGGNCTFIPNAKSSTYVLQGDDVGRRMRVRVTATNSAGSQTVASNATAVVTASAPKNTNAPSIAGTATQGQTLIANVGSWIGAQPIAYAYQWLRCDQNGNNCGAIAGQTRSSYVLGTSDVGHRLRVRVTASNGQGSASATSNATAVVQAPASPPTTLPPGAIKLPAGKVSIPASSVSLPARLIIDGVQFTPHPVRSNVDTFTLRAHVVDTRGYVVRDALVFARSTPLLTTTPVEARTGQDGWVTLTFAPRVGFPFRAGHNVQFFVRARKAGENVLGGVSTRRLIQVGTAR